MAIYPPAPEPFDCAICYRARPLRWPSPHMQDMPPLCWSCEQEWGVGAYGDCNPDRRVIKQISALAEALRVDAYRISIGEGPIYGRA